LTVSNRAGKLMPFLPAKSNRDAGGVARMERFRAFTPVFAGYA
jgi:hypothetical protein